MSVCCLCTSESTTLCECRGRATLDGREDFTPEEISSQHPKHGLHSDATGPVAGAGLSGHIHGHRLVHVSQFKPPQVIQEVPFTENSPLLTEF